MKQEDRELFAKMTTVKKIELPHKFVYCGWKCLACKPTVTEFTSQFVRQNLANYSFLIEGEVIKRLNVGTSGIAKYYEKKYSLEEGIKDFKNMINAANDNIEHRLRTLEL